MDCTPGKWGVVSWGSLLASEQDVGETVSLDTSALLSGILWTSARWSWWRKDSPVPYDEWLSAGNRSCPSIHQLGFHSEMFNCGGKSSSRRNSSSLFEARAAGSTANGPSKGPTAWFAFLLCVLSYCPAGSTYESRNEKCSKEKRVTSPARNGAYLWQTCCWRRNTLNFVLLAALSHKSQHLILLAFPILIIVLVSQIHSNVLVAWAIPQILTFLQLISFTLQLLSTWKGGMGFYLKTNSIGITPFRQKFWFCHCPCNFMCVTHLSWLKSHTR